MEIVAPNMGFCLGLRLVVLRLCGVGGEERRGIQQEEGGEGGGAKGRCMGAGKDGK